MSESKPNKRRDRAVVKVKDADGTWRELDTEPPPSDDPEIVALWDMPVGDLTKIVDDPEHPLHEKALVVTNHAFAPLTDALQEWFSSQEALAASILKPITDLVPKVDSLVPHIDSLVPAIDTSWISELVPKYPAWQELRRSLPRPDRAEPLVVDAIDFDSETPPDASLGEVASAAGDAAVVVLQQLLAVQREQLEQARADAATSGDALVVARESLEAAKGSRTAGWWAAGAAIAAALVAAAGIVVTILLSK